MTKQKMPAIAVWLLNRFGVPQNNESLMGDLVEEHGSGRSALWVWRQTAVAIAHTVTRDLRDHKLLTLRAVATGWAVNLAWARIIALASQHELWRKHQGLYNALLSFTFLALPAIGGWLVARTHLAKRGTMVLAYAASLAMYATWYLSANYSQMKACVQCSPDLWDTNLALNCLFLILTLIGGLLPRGPHDSGEPVVR